MTITVLSGAFKFQSALPGVPKYMESVCGTGAATTPHASEVTFVVVIRPGMMFQLVSSVPKPCVCLTSPAGTVRAFWV